MKDETTDEPKSKRTPIKCPHCAEEFNVENVAKYGDKTELIVTARVQEGCMFEAATVSWLIEHTGGLLRALSKELGADAVAFVKAISLDDKGELRVTFKTVRVVKDGE